MFFNKHHSHKANFVVDIRFLKLCILLYYIWCLTTVKWMTYCGFLFTLSVNLLFYVFIICFTWLIMWHVKYVFRLFIDSKKLSDDIRTHLTSENMSVTVLPYADISTHLAHLVCQGTSGTGKIWVLLCCTVSCHFMISYQHIPWQGFRASSSKRHCNM